MRSVDVDLGSAVVVNDIDGILRFAKGPIDPEIDLIIQAVRAQGARVGVMTGAPVSHLPAMELDFYWAESGAVQRDIHGADWVVLEAHEFARNIHEAFEFFWRDGYVKTSSGHIILEGKNRYASVCILTGNPPHYENPDGIITQTMDEVESWMRRSCGILFRDYTLSRGRDTTYEFLDITHPSHTKRTRMELFLSTLPGHVQVFYLGDSDSSDLPVMQLPRVIGVGFSNSGPRICAHVKERGIYIGQDGPTGGTLTYYRRLLIGNIMGDE